MVWVALAVSSRIGNASRTIKSVAPDSECAAEKQCLQGKKKCNFKRQSELAKPYQADPSRRWINRFQTRFQIRLRLSGMADALCYSTTVPERK